MIIGVLGFNGAGQGGAYRGVRCGSGCNLVWVQWAVTGEREGDRKMGPFLTQWDPATLYVGSDHTYAEPP